MRLSQLILPQTAENAINKLVKDMRILGEAHRVNSHFAHIFDQIINGFRTN